ncbi:hypothetical protein LTR84_010533 [Exophiala bonariae]|uniref:Uncharacterized protein n=1 Tax=Exophiala bonariae TaxID=1690606 RepID=A0AAV9MVY0_9EURO|nr:hypothetical protein LTR84_010533 [Exophiala bonariae]
MDFQVSQKLHSTHATASDSITTNSVLWLTLHYQDSMININDCDWEADQNVDRQFAIEIAFNAVDVENICFYD